MTEEFEKNVNEDLLDENESYPVMPLRNTVLFPQQVIPIYIGRDKSLKLINELSSKTKHVVVVAQEDGSIEDPEPSDMYSYGTCLLYTSPSPRDQRGSRMPSSA